MGWQGGPDTPALWSKGGVDFYAGTMDDVRLVFANMPIETKDSFNYDAIPWGNFHHAYGSGSDVPARLEEIRSGSEEDSRLALTWLWSSLLHSETGCAAGALTVPFLIRIAATHRFHRAVILNIVARLARRQHMGDGSRTGLLRAARADDLLAFESSGYLANWSIQAARQAVAADADLLLPLLEDIDPEVRQQAAYALAASAGRSEAVVEFLHSRLRVEDDPAVRACIVLAIGQLAWENRHAATIDQMRTWWQDVTRPAEVRVCAALSWLCLTDDAVADDLRAFLDASATDGLAALLAPIPWMIHVDDEGGGLHSCLDQMYNPEKYLQFTESLN
ncbi:HEAT repeat domain-containing protein [Kitasatospora phosalacinea]|uniref:HEAT repeat domain-containing protein n=1 Tax=Kitasatospora phosalacinea TaxID=2065 RepID=A0ABW6GMC1_9ACTN